MRILVSGGGTGGHITPIVAVAHELKRIDPSCHIIYVGERKSQFAHLINSEATIDESYSTYAGKFRRYHGQSWLLRIFDVKTLYFNLRDVMRLVIGVVQSWSILGKTKPDVVFLKGGFVGVPLGLMAALRKITIVTHDSDALPGLANKLVSRWATWHATGMPAEYYKYPKDRVKHVGVLVGEQYRLVDEAAKADYRKKLDLPNDAPILLVTGGSLGAARLNDYMLKLTPLLLRDIPELQIIHQVGTGNGHIYGEFTHERLQVHEFLKPMHEFTGASDVVITRAGANTLAELGVQGKACVVVPNPQLAGGHQLINAKSLLQQNAVAVVSEEELSVGNDRLQAVVTGLLTNKEDREALGAKLHEITIPDAANKLAVLLLSLAEDKARG